MHNFNCFGVVCLNC